MSSKSSCSSSYWVLSLVCLFRLLLFGSIDDDAFGFAAFVISLTQSLHLDVLAHTMTAERRQNIRPIRYHVKLVFWRCN
ncbi:hypothetical protein QBC38DRAFT_475219 [Podospora fimiseda]|uniref:Uncharacterized protein n=1 Tax=Podospora fimiseda TaxID=252190 RepID=A0AAN7BST6_9PEZI|nr:hypothetical protein QBC38DRAFT_475219 [Podospora fimiseda]